MRVEVRPPPGARVRYDVNCWSGTGDKDQSGAQDSNYDLIWEFNANAATRFWCQAFSSRGDKICCFPVFGKGVPKKSSTWEPFAVVVIWMAPEADALTVRLRYPFGRRGFFRIYPSAD